MTTFPDEIRNHITYLADVFVKNKIRIAKDCSNWDEAVKQLSRKVVTMHTPWQADVISSLDAFSQWKFAMANLRKFDEALITKAEKEACDRGVDGKYKNNTARIYYLNKDLCSATGFDQSQADDFLSSLNMIEPDLYEWAERPDTAIPETLSTTLFPDLYGSATLEDKKKKLYELARSTEHLRERFVQFKEKVPHAKNLKDHRRKANKKEKESFQDFQEQIALEIDLLVPMFQKSLEDIYYDNKIKMKIAEVVNELLPEIDLPIESSEHRYSADPDRNVRLKRIQARLDKWRIQRDARQEPIALEIGQTQISDKIFVRFPKSSA